MVDIWYATRETLKLTLDVKATAYANKRLDAALSQGSRDVEGFLHRRFYPELSTRYFDFPKLDFSPTWRLWLDANEVISVTSLVSGGTTISASDYFLRRADGREEPPYTYIEINLGGSASFRSGTTFQRAIALQALYGFTDDRDDSSATVATTINSAVTTLDVTSSANIGTGSLLIVDSERLVVSQRDLLTTGTTTTGADLTASAAGTTVTVSDGTKHFQNEFIYIDAETMQVRNVAGNTLIVQRAVDGSVLATHTTGATVYAPRRITVSRAALGTTAAAHNSGTTVFLQRYPGPVEALTIAYAINQRLQEESGYARVSGSGDFQKEFTGRGISDLENSAAMYAARRNRVGAI
jgi:hypothetical protein